MSRRFRAALLLAFSLLIPSFAFAQRRKPPNNDDSCDIAVAPAATLLLPHFQVAIPEIDPTDDTTTLFTVTNVSALPQIAHVTIWTDWSYPLLSFDLFLTGYDVQAINLFDVLVRGIVAPPRGTSSVDTTISPRPDTGVEGAIPDVKANPNLSLPAIRANGSCSSLPGKLPDDLMPSLRAALTTGLFFPACASSKRVGGTHTQARGYVTIDVSSMCSAKFPDDPSYIRDELLFDNVLIGDYQNIRLGQNFASASPMVHIRAIPEGGKAGSNPGTNLPYTFYDRYTEALPSRTFDRRQPLPSTFAARWIEGGTNGFVTAYTIWREGVTTGTQTCAKSMDNSQMTTGTVIRFDERENSFTNNSYCQWCPFGPPRFPAASRVETSYYPFPYNGSSADVAGWMYLDLDNDAMTGRPSQNWVVTTMFAQGRFSVSYDAAALGNGCSPASLLPSADAPVGPRP